MRKKVEWFDWYEVSDSWQVRSLKKKKPVNLAFVVNHAWYYKVWLYKDKKSHKKRVHRLVGAAFVPNPNNYPEINHIDYNRVNNKASNLEWTTHKRNYAYSSHRQKAAMRKLHSNKWYKEKQKAAIKKKREDPVFREKMKKLQNSPEQRNKIIEWIKKGKNKSKPIYKYSIDNIFIEKYDSAKDAAESIWVSYTTWISQCCRWVNESHKWYKRKYVSAQESTTN